MDNCNNCPQICVIMPVYNGEQTLKYALVSLLRQTYQNWVCVIVNDGSVDGTREILDSLTDSRFRVYHLEKNYGRGIARDVALSHAEGKYLAYLDADDMMHKDKLKIQFEYMELNPEIMLVSCGDITFGDSFTALKANCLFDFKSIKAMEYGQVLPLTLPASMIRLERAKAFHYNHSLDVGEDYDYFARYCEGFHYGVIGKAYYYYRINNVTKKKMIYYQYNSMRIPLVMWKRGLKLAAIKSIFLRAIKLITYVVLLTLIPPRMIDVIRRGKESVDKDILSDYKNEIAEIVTSSSNICE